MVANGAECGGYDGWETLPGMPVNDYAPCWAADNPWPNVGARTAAAPPTRSKRAHTHPLACHPATLLRHVQRNSKQYLEDAGDGQTDSEPLQSGESAGA